MSKDQLGAIGLVEAIRRDDISVADFLLTHVVLLHANHFALVIEHHAYLVFQLYLDLNHEIGTPLYRLTFPLLS